VEAEVLADITVGSMKILYVVSTDRRRSQEFVEELKL
jgi:hypothetical protein